MEPFSIRCTTCGRRLKVRDASLIGQIVACPKCQAMVFITEPASTTNSPQLAVGESFVDSQAETQDGLPNLAPLDTQAPRETSEQTKWNLENFEIPPVVASQPLPTSVSEQPLASHSPAAPLWESEASARKRQLLTIAAISLIGLTTVSAIFGIIVYRWQQANAKLADAQPVGPTKPNAGTNSAAAPPQEQTPPESLIPQEPTAPQEPSVPPGTAPSGTDANDTESDPAVDPLVPQEPALDPLLTPTPQDSAPQDPTPQDGAVTAPASTTPVRPDAANPSATEEPAAMELPASLRQYMPMLDLNTPAATLPKNDAPTTPTIADLKIQDPGVIAPETAYPPPADPVNIPQRLGARLLGFNAQDQPLDQVLRVLGQIAGVPLELDLMAFDLAQVRPDLPVSVQVDNRRLPELNVRILLEGILKKSNCRMQPSPDELVLQVLPSEELLNQGLNALLRVDGLSPEMLIASSDLSRFVGPMEAVATFKYSDDQKNLLIEGPLAAKVRAGLLLEALRIARNLPTSLPRPFTARWIVDTTQVAENTFNQVDWSPIPNTPVRRVFHQPAAVELILGELARESNAVLITHWSSAWSHGLTPETMSLPWLKDRTAPQVSAEMLDPFVLSVYQAGEGVWWLGAPEVYDQLDTVAILAIRPETRETILTQLANALALPQDQLPAILDEATSKLIVRLPRYVVRQLSEQAANQQ